MEITEEPRPSIWHISGLIILLTTMGIASLFFAVTILVKLLAELSNHSELVTIEKGIYYFFGVGLIPLILASAFIYARVFNNEMSHAANILFTWLIIGGLVLTFVIPQVIHYSVANYLEEDSYQVCEEKSRRWLHNVTIVYSKTLPCVEEESSSTGNGAGIY